MSDVRASPATAAMTQRILSLTRRTERCTVQWRLPRSLLVGARGQTAACSPTMRRMAWQRNKSISSCLLALQMFRSLQRQNSRLTAFSLTCSAPSRRPSWPRKSSEPTPVFQVRILGSINSSIFVDLSATSKETKPKIGRFFFQHKIPDRIWNYTPPKKLRYPLKINGLVQMNSFWKMVPFLVGTFRHFQGQFSPCRLVDRWNPAFGRKSPGKGLHKRGPNSRIFPKSVEIPTFHSV